MSHAIHIAKGDDVSVIIPTYNYGHFLDECLASVYQQEGVNTEIIVVDDGSTDNTKEVLEKHRSRVKYVFQENQGLSAARNTGIRASSGSYIQFLDADDRLGPKLLENKVAFLRKNDDQCLAISKIKLFKKLILNKYPLFAGYRLIFRNNLDVHLCRLNIAPPHAFLTPRHIIEKVGFFDEAMKGCEDYDYWLRALGKGHIPMFCPTGHVYYRIHGASMGARKATHGAFPYDVLVQEKKKRNEYGDGVMELMKKTEGKLAFCDGLLTTAIKIDGNVNPEGKNKLIDWAEEIIRRFIELSTGQYSDLTKLSRLYLTRILSKRAYLEAFKNGRTTYDGNELNLPYALSHIITRNLISSLNIASHDNKLLIASTMRMIVNNKSEQE